MDFSSGFTRADNNSSNWSGGNCFQSSLPTPGTSAVALSRFQQTEKDILRQKGLNPIQHSRRHDFKSQVRGYYNGKDESTHVYGMYLEKPT